MHNNDIINLLELEGVYFVRKEQNKQNLTLFFKRVDQRDQCDCGSFKLHIHDWRDVTLADMPIHGKKVKLVVSKQRYRCVNCNKRISSTLSFVDKYKRMTKRTVKFITQRLNKMNFKDIALDIGVSTTSVMRYFNQEVSFEIPNLNAPKILHIDEFKGTSDAGTYQMCICNGETNKLYDVLPDRNQTSLIRYFNQLNGEPEICVMDMWHPFRRAVNKTWENTIVVADKFHYVRQVQWALKKVRIKAQEKSKKNKKLKRYWKLFSVNTNKLTSAQISRLKELLALDEDLREAYAIKSYFDRYVTGNEGERAHEYFDEWLDMVQASKVVEIRDLLKTFENWYSEVVASFYYKRTNALAEGINNKIKVIKRQSYGIRKFNNLKKLLMLRIS